jgi:hypothetical protein
MSDDAAPPAGPPAPSLDVRPVADARPAAAPDDAPTRIEIRVRGQRVDVRANWVRARGSAA